MITTSIADSNNGICFTGKLGFQSHDSPRVRCQMSGEKAAVWRVNGQTGSSFLYRKPKLHIYHTSKDIHVLRVLPNVLPNHFPTVNNASFGVSSKIL